MKKYLLSFATIILVAIASVGLSSCSKDEPGKNEPTEPTIVGTWEFIYDDGDYVWLTFSGTENSGTVTLDEGGPYIETSSYSYSNGYLFMPRFENKRLKVTRLTSDQLTIQGWPYMGNCTFTRVSKQEVSLVGTWKCFFTSNSYVILTFYKDGTGVYEEFENGRLSEMDEYIYTREGNILTFHDVERYDKTEYGIIVNLTADKLVLKDFPGSGNFTFYRQ